MPRLGLSALDVRVGLRMLARYPVLTAASTAALAVAIALGVLYFEATSKARNPRLPIDGADRVVQLHQWDLERLTEESRLLHDFGEWRGAMRTVEQLGAAVGFSRNLTTSDRQVEPARGAEVTANAFVVAGTHALHGRTILPRDEEPGAPPVVVLGHRLWASRFERDPGVIGEIVSLGTVTATIVGVMPEGFAFPENEQLWTALRTDAVLVAPRDGPPVTVFGRLAEGATVADANAELAVLGARLATALPETHARLRPRVAPYGKPLAEGGESRLLSNVLVALNTVFLMLLAVMSANVATLVSARATTRSWEFTVRSALGASRGAVIKQLFAEALVLTALATVVGVVIARVALGLGVERLALSGVLPYWITPSLSWRTLLYAAALAVFGAAIIGVLPALRVARIDIQQALRSEGGGGASLKFGAFWTVLIVMQVAITVLFLPLVGNGVVESNRFSQRAAGIGAGQYVSADIWMSHEDYGLDSAERHVRALGPVAELERRLAAEPGVLAVAFADRLPVEDQFKYGIEIDTTIGKPATTNRASTLVHVAGDFFKAFGTEVIAGRELQPLDYETGRVLLVNQSFARYVLGGANPVGWRIRITSGEVSTVGGKEWYEIVGMVRDFGWQLPRPEEQSAMYLPSRPVTGRASQVVVRASDPDAVMGRMRTIAREVDPTIQLRDLESLGGAGSGEASINWTMTIVFGLVSSLVMLLSAMGIHALMSFTVSRRTREIGIRVALGAGARGIVTSIFRRAFLQLAAGLVIGSGIGVLMGMQSALQLKLLIGANAMMLAVGMLACALPVRRALRVDPAEALRAGG
jgi:putative ABC transport system permease protein